MNNTVCVANSQKLDLSTKYMRYHDTKPPYFSTQYRLQSCTSILKKYALFFFFLKELELYNLINRRKKSFVALDSAWYVYAVQNHLPAYFFNYTRPNVYVSSMALTH